HPERLLAGARCALAGIGRAPPLRVPDPEGLEAREVVGVETLVGLRIGDGTVGLAPHRRLEGRQPQLRQRWRQLLGIPQLRPRRDQPYAVLVTADEAAAL